MRYRGEKNTTYEGGFRVPAMVRWPGKIPAGSVVNEIAAHNDWAPTLLAAAGNDTIKQDLKAGTKLGDKEYKVHLDGYNLLPALMEGKSTTADNNPEWPRKNYIYVTDGGKIAGIRWGDWKALYLKQECDGLEVWMCPLQELRAPELYNLRQDPYEGAPLEAGGYDRWWGDHMFLMAPAAAQSIDFLKTFVEFPPRQVPGDWSLETVTKKLQIWENAQYK